MANLIITVISIALVAVAALMGAYYGGTAFLSGQAKSFANTLVTQGDQITSSWALKAADNGGSWTITNLTDLTGSTPPYLSSAPVAPTQAIASSSVSPYATLTSAWTFADISSLPGSTTTFNGVYVQIKNDDTGLSICKQVAQIIGGSTAVPTQVTVSTALVLSPSRKFDCTYYNSTPSTAVTSTNPMFMYYRAR